MIAAFAALTFVAGALVLLARELRGAGYGRERVPSIGEVGAERSMVLSSLAKRDPVRQADVTDARPAATAFPIS